MFTLFRNAEVYAPSYLGKKDVLTCYDKIIAIEDNINFTMDQKIDVIDCKDKYLFPGFIDLHVHITGGGGEGSYTTRTKEVVADDLLAYGVTTVVGVLGADGVTRSMANLFAKAKQLEQEGMSSYIFTGAYQVPVPTITGNVQTDMIFVDKVVGVGEICIEDNRSFEPTFDELSRLSAQVRNGALIAGKAGLVHFHLGAGDKRLDKLFELVQKTEIPKKQFLPTHVNRTKRLFEHALEYLQIGGYVDLTAGFIPDENDTECIPTYDAIKQIIDKGLDLAHVTMSSDANGSVPVFDENGNVISSDTVSSKILFEELRVAIQKNNVAIEDAISIITRNAATVLKIDQTKGTIEVGKHADLVLCDKQLNICEVYAMGKKFEA